MASTGRDTRLGLEVGELSRDAGQRPGLSRQIARGPVEPVRLGLIHGGGEAGLLEPG